MMKEQGKRLTDLWTMYHGGYKKKSLFIPHQEMIVEMERAIHSLQKDLSPLKPLTLEEERLKKQIIRLCHVLSFKLKDDLAYPHRYLSSSYKAISDLFLFYDFSLEEKGLYLKEINSSLEPLFHEILSLSSKIGKDVSGVLKNQLEALKSFLSSMIEDFSCSEGDTGKEMVLEEVREALEITENTLKNLKRTSIGKEITPLSYEETLRQVFGIELESLLSWYRDEVESCQKGLREIGERIDSKRHPFAILKEDLPPCNSREEMFKEMEGYVKRAKERTEEFLTLPQGEECLVVPIPQHLKDSYPWGGCSGPEPLSGIMKSLAFLNQYHYKYITRGWLMMMAIHECYPGHHTQRIMVSKNPLPSPFKLTHLFAPSGPIIEGQAHYAEKMLEDLFSDKAFPLFVAYRRLHTAVRIWADLLLHHYGQRREEAVQLYVDLLGFSHDEATGQVLFQELWPGYMTIYYYGVKFLEDLQERLSMDNEIFMQKIYKLGFIGIDLFHETLFSS